MQLTNTQINTLMESLLKSTVKIDFIKKDNTNRTLVCTLKREAIPFFEQMSVKPDKEAKTGPFVRVFDLENKGWRTVIFDSVTNFEVVS